MTSRLPWRIVSTTETSKKLLGKPCWDKIIKLYPLAIIDADDTIVGLVMLQEDADLIINALHGPEPTGTYI